MTSLYRPWLLALALAVSFGALNAGTAQAQTARGTAAPSHTATAPHVVATLVTDQESIAPGGSIQVGVDLKMDEHWHVYWMNPGDSGLPTRVAPKGPEGVSFTHLSWPAPKRMVSEASGDITYGYEGQVLLPCIVNLADAPAPKETITITTQVNWLVCHEECIPGSALLTKTIPVVNGDGAPTAAAPLFAQTLANVPAAELDSMIVETAAHRSAYAPGDAFEVTAQLTELRDGQLRADLIAPHPADGVIVESLTIIDAGPGVPALGLLVRIKGLLSGDGAKKGDAIELVMTGAVGDAPINAVIGSIPVPRLAAGATATVTEGELFPNAQKQAAALKAEVIAGAVEAGPKPGSATEKPPEEPAFVVTEIGGGTQEFSLGLVFLFALLGGIILNAMPCVLPVLSIKVLGLVQQAGEDRKSVWYHGLAYTAGIMFSFGVLAAVVVAIQAGGKDVGWGFQMQEPGFVVPLAAVVFAFALSLFGVFELSAPGANAMNSAASKKHGFSGSFANGVFATVLATPCSAPFLGPAMAYALSQPPLILTAILLTVGFGLALPFLLIAAFPAWSKWLPKPGAWMMTFKQGMGFLLIATTIWLTFVLSSQLSNDGLMGFLAFLGMLAFALWIYGHWGSPMRTSGVRWTSAIIAIAVGVLGGVQFLDFSPPEAKAASAAVGEMDGATADRPTLDEEGDINWRDFSTTDIEALSAAGHTVFVDFTADWCVTCKAYERTVIDTDEIKGLLAKLKIAPVKADWTNEDQHITKWLKRFKRAGVPMYLILPAGRPHNPILLPDLLTTGALTEGLNLAGASKLPETSK